MAGGKVKSVHEKWDSVVNEASFKEFFFISKQLE